MNLKGQYDKLTQEQKNDLIYVAHLAIECHNYKLWKKYWITKKNYLLKNNYVSK